MLIFLHIPSRWVKIGMRAHTKSASWVSLKWVKSSVVRALVCQPRGPGSNPCGIVQSQLVQGGKPI